jgi:arylsulfatase A-like enzyme
MCRQPNIILLTADSLRADRLGCYAPAHRPSLTPNIDNLARHGLRFTDVYAQGPYTAFSLPSIFTGKYPCRLKPMTQAIRWEKTPMGVLVEGTPTFVEMLRAHGYHTAAFHSNPLVSRPFGFDKGFDVFYDDVLASDSNISAKIKLNAARLQRIFRTDPYLGARALNAKVLGWLRTAPQPFFLWVHYMDTHGPYLTRKVLKYVSRGERLWRKSKNSPAHITPAEHAELLFNYHHQISTLDTELGCLWQAFEAEGLFDSSLLIFSADHGEEFLEHGGYSHTDKLYDELLHVPMIVSLPGARPAVVSELAALIQIAPTIVDFAGIPAADAQFDVQSLVQLFFRQDLPGRQFILAEAGTEPHVNVCVRTKEWKLILRQEGAVTELYDLSCDPLERLNLAAAQPHRVRELEAHLAAHRNSACAQTASAEREGPLEMTPAEEQLVAERLHDLGYL